MVFVLERDKVQRHFKVFRESKDREVQDLQHAKHEAELQLLQLSSVSSRDEKLDTFDNPTTKFSWASSIGSYPSVDSLTPSLRGSEFLHSQVERDGPFTNISRGSCDLHATLLFNAFIFYCAFLLFLMDQVAMFETFSQLLLFEFLKEKQKPRISQQENLLKYYLNKQ